MTHAFFQRQALRQFCRPKGRHADVLAKTAGGVHAKIEARDGDLITDGKDVYERQGRDGLISLLQKPGQGILDLD